MLKEKFTQCSMVKVLRSGKTEQSTKESGGMVWLKAEALSIMRTVTFIQENLEMTELTDTVPTSTKTANDTRVTGKMIFNMELERKN